MAHDSGATIIDRLEEVHTISSGAEEKVLAGSL
jgi:hypothetical protein